MNLWHILFNPRIWRQTFLCRYGFRPAAMGYNDKSALWYYASRVPKNGVIVEIGSFRGGSAALMATVNPDARIYCVDPWLSSAESYIYNGDIFKEFQQNTRNYPNITPLRGRSDEVAGHFIDKIDLLFIDGDHSYRGALTDLTCWNWKTKPQSYTIMHDADREGVRRAIIDYFGTFHIGTLPTRKMYVIEKDERLTEHEDKKKHTR